MRNTFYWHDYETWGADPSRDMPSQFAGIRTDMDFNIIGDPLCIYAQPARDRLPHPEACLITGITPQKALAEGLTEQAFIQQIHQQLAQPGTCALGYNTLRFDDEVTRYALYRNFYDPYAREWQHGNSRWDIIDMVRCCYALRPEGIEWPRHDDGKPSFKLEQLSVANGIVHAAAHDALSDVHATIGMAKLIKEKQPKLFDYLFQQRAKKQVAALLDVAHKKPLVHISAMYPSERGCAALVMPLMMHPGNKNGVIVYDLSADPTPLLSLDAEQIRERLFSAKADLPEGVERIALKTVHLNRCPVLTPVKLLDDAIARRLGIDLAACRRHYDLLKMRFTPDIETRLREVHLNDSFPEIKDPERMLYSGGFSSDADKQTMQEVRRATVEQLRSEHFVFEDPRYNEMLFRYRARNYPESLNDQEQLQWQEYCFQRLTEGEDGSLTMDEYQQRIETLLPESDAEAQRILHDLLDWGDELLAC